MRRPGLEVWMGVLAERLAEEEQPGAERDKQRADAAERRLRALEQELERRKR